MAQTATSRWESKFARFVRTYGAERLAGALDVHSSAIYHWIRGVTTPRPDRAAIIQRLAYESGVTLTFDDVYGHVSELRASDPAIAVAIDRRQDKAAARVAKKCARDAATEVLVKSLTARRSLARS
jgi:hypothetical protein